MPLCELSSLPVRKSFLSANLRPCCCLRESVEGGPWNYVDMGGSQAVNGAWDHRFKGPGWSRGMVQDEAGSPTRSKEGLLERKPRAFSLLPALPPTGIEHLYRPERCKAPGRAGTELWQTVPVALTLQARHPESTNPAPQEAAATVTKLW